MSLTPQRAHSGQHGRSPSGRVALTRRMTKGPLDAVAAADVTDAPNDPLAADSTPTSTTNTPARILSPSPARILSPDLQPITLDVSFLQDPAVYHVLPAVPTTAPPPFHHPLHAPPPAALDALLAAGHFRPAAIAAVRSIAAAAPTDYPALFHLVHVRLACLCLISEHALAAHEAKVLGDLNSAFYRHPLTGAHLVPWALRLLVVRLAALGYGEWRKAVMAYYELARECRENIVRSQDPAEKTLWQGRLRDCGIRVANTLVDMGHLEAAATHLRSISSTEDAELMAMETLVWLRVGDVASAERCIEALSPTADANTTTADTTSSDTDMTLTKGTLTALLHLSNAAYPSATTTLQHLHTLYPTDAMTAQNLAICLLYTGHISSASSQLSDLLSHSPPFTSLLFNLCTVFELCTERSRDEKLRVAEALAGRKDAGGVAWERGLGEFKL